MLDVDWFLFLNKIRREISGEKLWAIRKQAVVFKDGEVLGDDDDVLKFVEVRYRLTLNYNFQELGSEQLIRYIQQQTEIGNVFVYFTVSIDGFTIGTMLFEIYARVVPELTKHFLKLCVSEREGYTAKPIQRIVRPSWIQCGGWYINHYDIACENYIIPHDKRGVLSICNNGKHVDNHTQFAISLEPTPWMDYKFVAFGQLIYGNSILRRIEMLPTRYEEPLQTVAIAKSGMYELCSSLPRDHLDALHHYLSKRSSTTLMHPDVDNPKDVPSVLFNAKQIRRYYAKTDKRSHLPLQHLPSYLTEPCVCGINIPSTQSSISGEIDNFDDIRPQDFQTIYPDIASDVSSKFEPFLAFRKYKGTNQIQTKTQKLRRPHL
ncbi:hypothetical protein FQR65_LT05643 [Abscondita terminalis]|nr:hypothetical protein FQR65_LT05643 [Abscondita terminalis]